MSDESVQLAAADSAAENLLTRKTSIEIDPAREAALDAAFNAVSEVKTPTTAPEPSPEPAAAEEAPKAAKTEPKEGKTEPKEVKTEQKLPDRSSRKGLLDDLIADPASPAPELPEKAYEDIKLRSDASPKTVETFNAVKSRALERESAVRAELTKLSARTLELEAKLTEAEKTKGALPDEISKELKDHREFRALHDVSSRPDFKEKFDAKIAANFESVYSMFKQEGWDDAKVQALRNFSESQRVDFIENKILPLLTAGQRRVVEAKIYENVNITEEKTKAIDAARADAEKILAAQKEEPVKAQRERDTVFANTLRPKLQRLPYVYAKEVPSTATESERAEIEAHNLFAQELQEDIKRAITDDSPEIRADVVVAVPLARYLARENRTLAARAEAAEAKLAAIAKAGSTGRLGKAAAPDTAQPVRTQYNSSPEAVDALFQQFSGSRP